MVDDITRKKPQAWNAAQSIPLPKTCGRCGERGRIHRHHPDYAKPLVVQFLCARCHALTHREMASYKPAPPNCLELIGRDPRKIPVEAFGKVGLEGHPLLTVIRAKCLDCVAQQESEA